MSRPSLSLTALGVVNALGQEPDAIWEGLRRADSSGLTLQDGFLKDRPVRVGLVQGPLPVFPQALQRYACRNNALVLSAFQQIEAPVRQAIQKYGAERIGVVLGSSTSGIAATESAFAAWKSSGNLPESFDYVQHEMGGVSQFLAELLSLQGPAYTLSTACSSSAKVFASARALMQQDWCDAVIVGGADSLCRLTVQGFSALDALSANPCNSMSANRDGFNIGEGAALFLMEAEGNGPKLLGIGESSDAHHISAPDPQGLGAQAAMSAALKDAALRPEDVSYIQLHGTGTPLNDQMESRAVDRLFKNVPVSSSKGMVGHTLGASGAMGVAFCWLSLTRAEAGRYLLPPHRWDGERDPALPALSLVDPGAAVEAKQQTIFLSNSFGFGGSNCSVIVGNR